MDVPNWIADGTRWSVCAWALRCGARFGTRFVADPAFRSACLPCVAAGLVLAYGTCAACRYGTGHERPSGGYQVHIAAPANTNSTAAGS